MILKLVQKLYICLVFIIIIQDALKIGLRIQINVLYAIYLLKFNVKSNNTATPEEKAVRDINADGVVDRMDVHALNAYLLVRDKTDGYMYLPELILTKANLDLVADGVINQKDFEAYLTKTTGSASYIVDYDMNSDGRINDVDYQIFKLIADNDENLINLLK